MNSSNKWFERQIESRSRPRVTALDRWIKQHQSYGSFKEKNNRSDAENELLKLRKEVQQFRMENDILKQAAMILGRK